MTDQRCGTCRHWRSGGGRYGACKVTVTIPTLPSALKLMRQLMEPSEGTNCPTWEASDE